LPKAPIKLIASDLDGTMLDSSGAIPERNIRAVSEAIRLGVTVTISTGRMYKSAEGFAKQLNLANTPIICYNGAMIRDALGNTLTHLKLDMEVAREMLAVFRDRNIYVQSYIDDELYVRENNDANYLYYSKHFGAEGTAVGDALFSPSPAADEIIIEDERPRSVPRFDK